MEVVKEKPSQAKNRWIKQKHREVQRSLTAKEVHNHHPPADRMLLGAMVLHQNKLDTVDRNEEGVLMF